MRRADSLQRSHAAMLKFLLQACELSDALVEKGFDPAYPLHGCRRVLFEHDEFILEVPADPWWAHFANLRLKQHMIEGMQKFIPDVPVKAEESLMDRWHKAAEPVFDVQGRLTLWHPKEAA